MEYNSLIYEENGYVYIYSKSTYNQILESKFIDKNLFGFKDAIYEVDNLEQTIEEAIYSVNIPIICVLISLNAFIEIDNTDYERVVMIKNFINKNKRIDLKENETIKYIFFKRLDYNQSISLKSLPEITDRKINNIYVSTFLDLDEKNIEQIYITTNLTSEVPNREVTVELIMINRTINDKLIIRACRTLKILSKKYLSAQYKQDYNVIDVSLLLKKGIESCVNYLENIQ